MTVIAPDPVEAEVLSKSLFLEGRRRIADEAARVAAAAFWVHSDGTVGESPHFGGRVIWRAAA